MQSIGGVTALHGLAEQIDDMKAVAIEEMDKLEVSSGDGKNS